jgi:hypothetical protein
MSTSYATLEQVKAVVPDVDWGTAYNAEILRLIARVSRTFDKMTKRYPGAYLVAAATVRYFDGVPNWGTKLWIDELAAVPTKIEISPTGKVDGPGGTGGTYDELAVASVILLPHDAPAKGVPYKRIHINTDIEHSLAWPIYRRSIKITGKWGYSTSIPDDVNEAVIAQTVRMFKQGQQGFRDVSAIAEIGQLRYAQALDPFFASIVEAYKRPML